MTERLISHGTAERSLDAVVAEHRRKIVAVGDTPTASVADHLSILEQLTQFELGRFLLANQGLNGFWTHDAVFLQPRRRRSDPNIALWDVGTGIRELTDLEGFVLNEAPTMLATQDRFDLFQRAVQAELDRLGNRPLALASVPCGLMADLLTLNLDGRSDVRLAGFDLDDESLQLATQLARRLDRRAEFVRVDAWHLDAPARFDLLVSNGLNIYEPDDDRVRQLYELFASALRPGGLLVTSYLTPPTDWDRSRIDLAAARRQKLVLADVVGAKWQCFRSTELTRRQLTQAGFVDIVVIPDRANMFPTILGRRP